MQLRKTSLSLPCPRIDSSYLTSQDTASDHNDHMKMTIPSRPFRVLIVDDDPPSADLLAKDLRQIGYEVSGVFSVSSDVLATVQRTTPDVVLLDIGHPPHGNAVKTAHLLRQAVDVVLVFLAGPEAENAASDVADFSPAGFLGKPVRPHDLQVTLALALRRHAHEAAERKSLQSLAQTDPLTGLGNRRHLYETLDNEWERCRHDGSPLGILMIDIDHFKQFNDSCGHAAGDRCLTQVAGTLLKACGDAGATVGRWGGEEFLAVLPGKTAEQACHFGEQLIAQVAATTATSPDQGDQPPVTISVGAAVAWPAAVEGGWQVLVSDADDRLYDAKLAGRNQLVSKPPHDDGSRQQ